MIPPEASAKFSSEQRFLCKRMGTLAPMLPVHGEAECRKFDEMLRGGNSDQNWDKMSVDWCQHVDGVTIFPKLPVYLRTHHTAWARNQRVKEAVRKAAPGEAVLARLNEKTRQELLPEPARPSPTVAVAVGAATAAAPPLKACERIPQAVAPCRGAPPSGWMGSRWTWAASPPRPPPPWPTTSALATSADL